MHTNHRHLIGIPASCFGLSEPDMPECLGYSVESLSETDRARIPAVNPAHRFSPQHACTLALWWRRGSGEPLYISGPSGSGKTSTALQFCARLAVPVVSVTARPRMDRRELIGHWSVVSGETRWIDGPASLAWRHGWVLLINEFSAAPAEMWVSANDILEGLPLDVEATGEVIPRHPCARVIVTDNTRGHAAEIEEGFYGRQIQDRSVIDRFWHLRMEPMQETEEAQLLFDTIPSDLVTEFEEKTLRRLTAGLAKAAADSRAAAAKATLGFASSAVPLSLRSLTRLRDLILEAALAPFGANENLLLTLIRIAFTEALDKAPRETAEALLVTALGDAVKSLRLSRGRRVVRKTAGVKRVGEAA